MTSSQLKLAQLSTLLKQRANKYAVLGLSIALLAVCLGTLAACYVAYGRVGIGLIAQVQISNPALWLLDAMPWLFAFWGQYVGTELAYNASALVFDETQDLRTRASTLEYQLKVRTRGQGMEDILDRDELLVRISNIITRSGKDASEMALMHIEFELVGSTLNALNPSAKEELMTEIKKRFEGLTRGDDPVAYLGDGKFAIVLLNYGGEPSLSSIAARMRRGFIAPLMCGDKRYAVHPQVGVAVYPRDAEGAELLVQRAALAVRTQKDKQADFSYYRPQIEQEVAAMAQVSADLFAAIENDQLTLYCQPCLSAADMQLAAVRLEIAWHHPSKGTVETDEIFEIAEQVGQAATLDIQKLNEFCACLTAWSEQRHSALLGFARLAFSTFINPFTPKRLVTLLRSYGVNPQQIAIEVTEHSLREGGRAGLDAIKRLRKEGLCVLLAGVGGDASLVTVLRHPVDFLMLDRELVNLMVTDERALRLARLMGEIAHDNGMKCVADGVWSEMHYEALKDLPIDYLLGQYAGGGMCVEDFEKWLRERGASGHREPKAPRPGTEPLAFAHSNEQ